MDYEPEITELTNNIVSLLYSHIQKQADDTKEKYSH